MTSRRIYATASLALILAALGAFSTLQAEQTSNQATAKAEESDRPLAIKQADAKLSWGDCPALFPPGCKIAMLHGDPAKPGADVFFRVPAGYTIPAHWHTSAERMVLVSGTLDVTYAGHPTVRLETNDYAYGPAKLPHVAKCMSKTPCTLFIAFDEAVDAHPFEEEIGAKS
jgi:mannose-6-phosphate isomerase-like protein (cupin superfamily)